MSEGVSVSVVVPAMNEEALLKHSVDAIRAGAPDAELIVIENGSVDDTYRIASDLASAHPAHVRVLRLSRADYGAALHAGIQSCRGSIAVIFNVDYYDLGFLRDAERAIGEGADVVLARKLGSGAVDRRAFHRRLATRVFSSLVRRLYGLRVLDTHGIKAINMQTMAAIVRTTESRRDMYDTEFIIRAQRAGARIVEVPATVTELRSPRLSLWRRVPRTVRDLIALRIRLWRTPGPGSPLRVEALREPARMQRQD
jgi:arabinofuranan 3-O-arabinosyltransferase